MPDPTPAPLTPEDLRELVEMEKNSTPGDWTEVRDQRDWLRAVRIDRADHVGVVCVAKTYRGVRSTYDAKFIVALRNLAPRLFAELLALREENERLRRERADGGTKAMPPRSPPPPPPRPVRAVAGTSLVCTACGCRWKKHPPDDVFPNGSLQLYDADQRPCVECCDNTSNPPLRHETPNDAKGDPS